MKNERPTDKELRKVFAEIIDGYTCSEAEGRNVVIRHLNNADQYALERHYDTIYNRAREKGLPTEEESLEVMIEADVWSREEESAIADLEVYVKNLEQTKKNLIIPSQITKINKDIDEGTADLLEKKNKRKSLLSETCESYARNKNNDYSIYLSLYRDKDLKEKFFTWDEFCEVPKSQLNEWFVTYMNETKHLSPENIKYLAINAMFALYYNLLGSKNLHTFFPQPIYELSFYQLNLLNYGKILNSILENIEGIPEEIKKEPDDLLAYAESKNKHKDLVDKSKDKQGFSVMGATKKDMDEIGVSDELAVSPFELAKKKGALTIEDFQDFS